MVLEISATFLCLYFKKHHHVFAVIPACPNVELKPRVNPCPCGLSSSRAMWPSHARSPSWWPAPFWAPAAASCRFRQQRLPQGVSLSASSSGRGTQTGCCCLCSWTQSPRDWSCRSATAGCTWPSTTQCDKNQRSLQVSPQASHTHRNHIWKQVLNNCVIEELTSPTSFTLTDQILRETFSTLYLHVIWIPVEFLPWDFVWKKEAPLWKTITIITHFVHTTDLIFFHRGHTCTSCAWCNTCFC